MRKPMPARCASGTSVRARVSSARFPAEFDRAAATGSGHHGPAARTGSSAIARKKKRGLIMTYLIC